MRRVAAWGWGALAAGGAALGLGLGLGWPELAAPGGVVLAVFALGAAASIGGPKLGVALSLARRRVPAGGDLGASLTVTNLGPRRIGPRRLTVPVGPAAARAQLPGLAPGASATARLAAPPAQRGLWQIGPAQAVRGDPLGAVGRLATWGEPLQVAVYPALQAVPVGAAGLAQDLDGRPNGRPAAADASFHALRDYQPGDDRRAVHWRSTAWRGRLMVRQSEDTRRGRLALLVSAAGQEYASPNDFELAVSVYASLGAAQLAAGGELALVGQGAVLALARGGPGALLDHAAAAQLAPVGAAGQSLAQAVARWRAQAPGGAWAVMVTGGVLPETDLARLARRLPRAAAVLALRCRLGAAAEVGRRDRLGLATVGHLDQLAGALRRLGLR